MNNFKIDFDRRCAFKPAELGMTIARKIGDGSFDQSWKFLSYRDIVSTDESDKSHICVIDFLKDDDNSISDLVPMSNIAVWLTTKKDISNECGEDEGLAVLICENDLITKYDKDNRHMIIRLDDVECRKYLSDCIDPSETNFWYDETQDLYYNLVNVGCRNIERIEKQLNEDYISFHKKSEDDIIAMQIKKNYPDLFNKLKFVSNVIDTKHIRFDENDQADRHTYKYIFRLYDENNQIVHLDGIKNKISFPTVNPEKLTFKNIVDILKYHITIGSLFENDIVIVCFKAEQSSFPVLCKFKPEYRLTDDEREIFGKSTVENFITALAKTQNDEFQSAALVEDHMSYLNRDDVKADIKNRLEFLSLNVN